MSPSPWDAVEAVTARAFRAASAVRGAKVFHPEGVLARGEWRTERATPLAPGARAFRPGFRAPALIRFSRGVGLPDPMPDILGAAVRIENAYGAGRHQDLLFVTSADGPVVHHAILPATGWFAQSYSTSLPYRGGNGNLLFGLLPPEDDPDPPGPSVDAIARRAARGFEMGIAVAGLMGRWDRVGTLAVTSVPPSQPEVRFNPWQTGGGLVPAGPIQRLRRRVYRDSQRGWGTRRP